MSKLRAIMKSRNIKLWALIFICTVRGITDGSITIYVIYAEILRRNNSRLVVSMYIDVQSCSPFDVSFSHLAHFTGMEGEAQVRKSNMWQDALS